MSHESLLHAWTVPYKKVVGSFCAPCLPCKDTSLTFLEDAAAMYFLESKKTMPSLYTVPGGNFGHFRLWDCKEINFFAYKLPVCDILI
jgi:hypothetical protein